MELEKNSTPRLAVLGFEPRTSRVQSETASACPQHSLSPSLIKHLRGFPFDKHDRHPQERIRPSKRPSQRHTNLLMPGWTPLIDSTEVF
uniref:Uncharacterized protein n=1 Tax=Tenebrio molitor TaxID=7067 RepID=A0A8J6L6D9_TENMO|nr:hypothetical protein GEV33_014853 [Tenebrio molitor]